MSKGLIASIAVALCFLQGVWCNHHRLPESLSTIHGCDRTQGEVWCRKAPIFDSDHGEKIPFSCSYPLDLAGGLQCLPANASLFSKDFMWGTATAAYQVEGAVHEGGRGTTIWDVFSHTPGKTVNGDTGDVADDNYHHYREDILLAKALGTTHYRLSIAWARIYPTGLPGKPNEEGIWFYMDVIKFIKEMGMEPIVTLYHWDLPLTLDEQGGWLSKFSVDAFVEYSRACFNAYGHMVKYWLTFNEPHTFIRQGYSEGNHAPGRCSDRSKCSHGDSLTEPYIAAHHVLLAHAQAVQYFRSYIQPQYGGEIGITLNVDWAEPASSKSEDTQASQHYLESMLGWFADPIAFGDYPEFMRETLGHRLPQFTSAERKSLTGSIDFFAMNHYNSFYVTPLRNESNIPFWSSDLGLVSSGWNTYTGQQIGEQAASPWLFNTPGGLYNVLHWINDRYGRSFVNFRIVITENGCDAPKENEKSFPEVLDDRWRVAYYFEYLEQLAAVKAEGVNVIGYFAWSLLDNFEWSDGYQMRFGLHYVDYSDPTRPRHAKKSASWYRQFISTTQLLSLSRPVAQEKVALPPSSDLSKVISFVVLLGVCATMYYWYSKFQRRRAAFARQTKHQSMEKRGGASLELPMTFQKIEVQSSSQHGQTMLGSSYQSEYAPVK